LTAAGIRRAFERPDRLGETAGRGLSQRTLSEARHDRINPSKNTRRHSALSVHAWVSRCSSSATMVLGLNGVQNGPGPFNGFVRTLEDAKAKFAAAWGAWLKAAGLNEDTPQRSLRIRNRDDYSLPPCWMASARATPAAAAKKIVKSVSS
jgi:hypothetical protein